MKKFHASYDYGKIQKILTYNQSMDKIESEEGNHKECKFESNGYFISKTKFFI